MVQVDGKSGKYGINLHDFAALLIEMGAVNAINLDGGGSSVAVANGTIGMTHHRAFLPLSGRCFIHTHAQ